MKFDVRYYLVAILFILFDLEIAFLFPWAIVLPDIGIFGFWSMMIFLGILIIGFVYEWKRGANGVAGHPARGPAHCVGIDGKPNLGRPPTRDAMCLRGVCRRRFGSCGSCHAD